MTDPEINARVAELAGWRNVSTLPTTKFRVPEGFKSNQYYGEPDDDFNRDVDWHKENCTGDWRCSTREYHREPVCDYVNDLNCCHEAESHLTHVEAVFYAIKHLDNNVSASARQRATALALLQSQRVLHALGETTQPAEHQPPGSNQEVHRHSHQP